MRKIAHPGVFDFQDSGEGFNKEGEVIPPSELCILPILNFLTKKHSW